MLLPSLAVIFGLILLVWSADQFIDGAASTARYFDTPPLLIGMVIVGFGTSAPEMVISAISALEGNPGIALGNAYGSNIANIALVLGATALVSPIVIQSQILRKELPLLTGVTVLAAWQLFDGEISRLDAAVLLAVFFVLLGWSIVLSLRENDDQLAKDIEQELPSYDMTIRMALFWLISGLLLLVLSSRILVWGAVEVARGFGVSDLVIGLTVIAIGTSLPELASSLAAAKKKEHDIAIGNILGSCLFNTLAVVGIAGAIRPMAVNPEVITRDLPVMFALTLSLFVIGAGVRKQGVITRAKGAALLFCYLGYTLYLAYTTFGLWR